MYLRYKYAQNFIQPRILFNGPRLLLEDLPVVPLGSLYHITDVGYGYIISSLMGF